MTIIKEVEENALKYNLVEVPELTLSLEYQNGNIYFPETDNHKGFDVSA